MMMMMLTPLPASALRSGVVARLVSHKENASSPETSLEPGMGYKYDANEQTVINWLKPDELNLPRNKKLIQSYPDPLNNPLLFSERELKNRLTIIEKPLVQPALEASTWEEPDKQRALFSKDLIKLGTLVEVDPILKAPQGFTPSEAGTFTPQQQAIQNRLLDEQDKQLAEERAKKLQFKHLGVPPVPANKVIGLRQLKQQIEAEAPQVMIEPSANPALLAQKSTHRDGAVFKPYHLTMLNTLEPDIDLTCYGDGRSITASPQIKNLLFPNQPLSKTPCLTAGPNHYGGFILTGEDALKEAFAKKITSFNDRQYEKIDPYVFYDIEMNGEKRLAQYKAVAKPIDVTPYADAYSIFSAGIETRLSTNTNKEVLSAKEAILKAQDQKLATLRQQGKTFHTEDGDIPANRLLSLSEAVKIAQDEQKALPAVEVLLPKIRADYWQQFPAFYQNEPINQP